MAWRRDVDVGERGLTTTGGKTWGAAFRLADYLEAEWVNVLHAIKQTAEGDLTSGVGGGSSASNASYPHKILELGSGTGWLGMTLARNVAAESPEGSVCLTEQAEGGAMEWLQDNLDSNKVAGLPLGAVQLAPLDWRRWLKKSSSDDAHACAQVFDDDGSCEGTEGRKVVSSADLTSRCPEDPCMMGWDVVLGSDLIYSAFGVKLLPRVLSHLLQRRPGAVVLYAHTLHRYDHFDLDFLQELRQQGLNYKAVAAENAKTPEDAGADLDPLANGGDGFLEELFPEMRVVVFQISLATSTSCISQFLPWSMSLAAEVEKADGCHLEGAVVNVTEECTTGVLESEEKKRIVKVGQIVVCLPGATAEDAKVGSQADSIVIWIPQLGPFGSGEHPTTELMLRGMQDAASGDILGCSLQGLAVCDYGCGSAVLALAALALGASRAIGIDIVLDALDASSQNARANAGLTGWVSRCEADVQNRGGGQTRSRLNLYLPEAQVLDKDLDFYSRYGNWRVSGATAGWQPVPDGEFDAFDVVIANIVVGPLCNSASAVLRLVRPGGQVLLAGMRQGMQTERVQEVYGAHFELRHLGELRGWVLLGGKRRDTQSPC